MELEVIKSKIYEIRGQRVMLDRDLAQMYGVETKVLNQAVRRNLDRFPEDFMFMLTLPECKVLEISMRSQFVTSKMGRILTIEQSGKDNAEAISDLSDDIQKELDRLRMENKLLRDFLQSTERM